MKLRAFATAFAVHLALATYAFALEVDKELPPYAAASGLSGTIKSVGSDTLGSLMKLWAEGFKTHNSGVTFDIESKGSSTAPPALIDGESQFAPMSRPMKTQELDAFEKKYGYKPTRFRVAVDALAIYVNKDNPLKCLTMQQLEQIFSKNRWGIGGVELKSWGSVGLTGAGADTPFALYGRNGDSGTHDFFREFVLYGTDFKDAVQEQADSATVVQKVAADKSAIGYSGIGYKTDGVRTVPLAISEGRTCYDTSPESTYSGNYPLARYLFIYINKQKNRPVDPLTTEFVKYLLSKDGQELTIKGGFYPITNAMRMQDLQTLGINTGVN